MDRVYPLYTGLNSVAVESFGDLKADVCGEIWVKLKNTCLTGRTMVGNTCPFLTL